MNGTRLTILKKEMISFQKRNSVLLNTLLLFCILFVVMCLSNPYFRNPTNISDIFNQAAPTAIAAMGISSAVVCHCIDLSVGAVIVISTLPVGHLVANGLHPILGIFLTLAIGCCCGILNAFLVTKVNIPAFLVTLATAFLYRGIGRELVHGENTYNLPAEYLWFGKGKIGPFNVTIVLVIGLALLLWFFQNFTKTGRHIYAVGGNPQAAQLSGISVHKQKFIVYMISGTMSALAGLVIVGRMGATYADAGANYDFIAITAACVGGISILGGIGTVWNAFIGAYFVQLIKNILPLLGLGRNDQVIINGLVIVVAIGIDYLRKYIGKYKISPKLLLKAKKTGGDICANK